MTDIKPLALVVDDEPDIRELLEITLARMEVDAVAAADLTEAKALLLQHRFHLCLTDMKLPDGNGIDLVRHIQKEYPHLPVAVITAHGNMNAAIEALKAGAFDFVNKPVELQMLRELVNQALKLHGPLEGESAEQNDGLTIVGDSLVMEKLRTTIKKLSRSQAPIYIGGESGTGKELVARMIHQLGPRSENPFVAVNCGAIPRELMESEFFGHTKGSFTGANSNKDGLFQAAHGGTLFLDEVADLPMDMQVKLLRAIQEKAIRPIGSQKEVHIDVRILSATHKSLANEVKEGRFREDLFYRLNVIEVNVPPLRERPEDLEPLIEHILAKLAQEMEIEVPHLNDAALALLKEYDFPGNVRELENILERAVTLCEGNTIETEDLRLKPADPNRNPEEEMDPVEVGLEHYLEELEKKALVDALEKTNHNKTAAADLLGISFRAIRYRLKKLGLD